MAWLVNEDRVLASAQIANDRRSRRRGLIGVDHLDGALVLQPCNWVHTFKMSFDLDVAYLDADGAVVKSTRMRRNRLGVPVFGATSVIEAQAGAFARWGLRVGDIIEIRRSTDEWPAP
ncbi:MAG: DUF192 domain-containing protein [Actinomycetota bacterium]|nr:DUF192 domain-containing protein [Actinomycetota bacterium]